MAKIHTSPSVYVPPAPVAGYQWLPIVDAKELQAVKDAVDIIDRRIKGHAPCEAAFAALPGGKTFTQIWNDPNVWISHYPSTKDGDYGATLNQLHVTISRYAIRMGKWTIAATLVHELAHVNGAGGADTKAEDTLKACLLKGLHDPNVIGNLLREIKPKALIG